MHAWYSPFMLGTPMHAWYRSLGPPRQRRRTTGWLVVRPKYITQKKSKLFATARPSMVATQYVVAATVRKSA